MSEVNREAIVNQLKWRYATKMFDPSKKIPDADWKTLEQTLVLSPSSYGIQPWKFFVVSDAKQRQTLRGAAWNQSQVTDASHLIVFAVRKDLNAGDIDRYVARISEVRGVPVEALAGYRGMMVGSLARPVEKVTDWSARQAYIALGGFLTVAALLGVDACPMEGFDSAKFDEILGLGDKGYASVVIATAGYRAADDASAKYPKVRFATEEVVVGV